MLAAGGFWPDNQSLDWISSRHYRPLFSQVACKDLTKNSLSTKIFSEIRLALVPVRAVSSILAWHRREHESGDHDRKLSFPVQQAFALRPCVSTKNCEAVQKLPPHKCSFLRLGEN